MKNKIIGMVFGAAVVGAAIAMSASGQAQQKAPSFGFSVGASTPTSATDITPIPFIQTAVATTTFQQLKVKIAIKQAQIITLQSEVTEMQSLLASIKANVQELPTPAPVMQVGQVSAQ